MTTPSSIYESAKSLMDDYFKQVGSQAALLAGFSFAILAFLPQENKTHLTFWFVLCAVLAIVLELLAAFILCMLSFFTKVERIEMAIDSFVWENRIALLSYLFGITSFLASIVLLAWIRFIEVAPVVTCVVALVFVLGVVLLIHMVVAHDRIADPRS